MALAQQFRAARAQHFSRRRIDIGKAPVPVESKETVGDTLEHRYGFVPRRLRLGAELSLPLGRLPAKPGHLQAARPLAQKLARSERLLQVVGAPASNPSTRAS